MKYFRIKLFYSLMLVNGIIKLRLWLTCIVIVIDLCCSVLCRPLLCYFILSCDCSNTYSLAYQTHLIKIAKNFLIKLNTRSIQELAIFFIFLTKGAANLVST